MKHIFFILLLVLFSCKKETPVVNTPTPTAIDEAWDLFYGKDKVIAGQPTPNIVKWVLVSGEIYMENLSTGYKIKYSHFDSTRVLSSLRYGGIEYDIEILEVGQTTWQFRFGDYNSKEFILNNDTIHPYGYNETANYRSIIEFSGQPDSLKLGGSARPFSVWTKDYDAGLIQVKIQDGYESIGTYNWKYFSVLTFKLVD